MFECRDVRLSHLSAVAVMIALVGAMFVAMGSVSAHTGTGIHIDFDDSDDTVKAGTIVEATIAGLGDNPNPAADTTNWTAPLGLLFETGGNQYSRKHNNVAMVKIDTTGADDGDYTITAVYNSRPYTRTLRIGDAGKGVGSVEVTLGHRIAVGDAIDDNVAAAIDVVAETGSASHTDTINVVVTTTNSLGNPTNDGDVETIILFVDAQGHAQPGRTGNTLTADGAGREDNSVRVDDDTDGNDDGVDEANATSHFTVGASEVAAIDVYAIVIGDGGTATSETITLNFTGEATALSLGDASDALQASGDAFTPAEEDDNDDTTTEDPAVEGGITFAVSGTDKGGSTVVLATSDVASVKITDSADKDVTSKFHAEQTKIDSKGGEVIVRIGTGDTAVASGDYTVEVSLASDATVKAMADFHVAGKPANVEVTAESNADPVELGSVISVTATVTDEGGIGVADGTYVDFSAGGALVLSSVGKVTNVMTKDGVATARFIVSRGSGLAVIIVDASDTSDESDVDASGTASVSTEAEAMPEEEASVACLSNLAGFATWACGVESSASEIFGLVSGRGATALHLWNGSAWVRYSVVDGTMVPGSSDFMVAENDILYISN